MGHSRAGDSVCRVKLGPPDGARTLIARAARKPWGRLIRPQGMQATDGERGAPMKNERRGSGEAEMESEAFPRSLPDHRYVPDLAVFRTSGLVFSMRVPAHDRVLVRLISRSPEDFEHEPTLALELAFEDGGRIAGYIDGEGATLSADSEGTRRSPQALQMIGARCIAVQRCLHEFVEEFAARQFLAGVRLVCEEDEDGEESGQ